MLPCASYVTSYVILKYSYSTNVLPSAAIVTVFLFVGSLNQDLEIKLGVMLSAVVHSKFSVTTSLSSL